jgi:hypothetical protein
MVCHSTKATLKILCRSWIVPAIEVHKEIHAPEGQPIIARRVQRRDKWANRNESRRDA